MTPILQKNSYYYGQINSMTMTMTISEQVLYDRSHICHKQYNIPLCVAFVDYEKAFDSVQTQAILTSLQEQGIEDV